MQKSQKTRKNSYKQGYYTPKKPEKYVGDLKNIYFRSGWELKLMLFFDMSSRVKRWSSEPFAIKYMNKLDNKIHRYYIDFYLELDSKKFLIEVKPEHEVLKPKAISEKASFKKIQNYNRSCETYIRNMSKWEAAKAFCDKNGFIFKIFTEDDFKKLNIKT